MSDKKFILVLLLAPLPFVLALLGLLYIYDPFQVYHKPYFRETTFFGDMRRQAKGIIKNYDFDSYILGTSMLENTYAKEAEEKLGGKWVNISLAGSAFNERAVVLEYLFKTKEAKSIIYSLDITYLERMESTKKFDYLYDENFLNDIKGYMNMKFFSCALVYSTREKCVGKDKNLEKLNFWANNIEHNSQFGGFENWIKYSNDKQHLANALKILANSKLEFQKSVEDISKIKENLENNLLRFVKENPQTEFSIIIPTYPRLFFYIKENKGYLDGDVAFYKYKQTMQWLIPHTKQFKNLKFYAFDTLLYADDIANYKDLNSIFLSAIRDKTHILDSSNIGQYLKEMESKILEFDLSVFVKMAKE